MMIILDELETRLAVEFEEYREQIMSMEKEVIFARAWEIGLYEEMVSLLPSLSEDIIAGIMKIEAGKILALFYEGMSELSLGVSESDLSYVYFDVIAQ
ncbi:MAG: hypothetical protein ACRC6X_02645 [Culicoidibacterales bacterium]